MIDMFLVYYMVSGFLKIALPIVTIILSIVILIKKDKRAKLLALYCLLLAIANLVTGIAARMSRVSVEAYSSASSLNSVIGFLMTIAGLISICIYAKNEYGSNVHISVPFTYAGILLVGSIVNNIVAIAVRGYGIHAVELSVGIGGMVVSALACIAPMLIIRAFFTGREKEWQFPKMWKLLVLITAITFVWDILTNLMPIVGSETDVSVLVGVLQDVINLISLMCRLLIAIYVLRHVKSKKEE
ncbi:hypothetical protein SAMN06296952_1741 [Oscillospiraceae bacterium]|nr:hypothetical protein SAMN06296952_1741 [Oscillospiraceae bacterium]